MPKININGKSINTKPLTMGVYRQIIKLQAQENITDAEALDNMAEIIGLAYGVDAAEVLAEDVIPAYREVVKWANESISAKVQQIPNA